MDGGTVSSLLPARLYSNDQSQIQKHNKQPQQHAQEDEVGGHHLNAGVQKQPSNRAQPGLK